MRFNQSEDKNLCTGYIIFSIELCGKCRGFDLIYVLTNLDETVCTFQQGAVLDFIDCSRVLHQNLPALWKQSLCSGLFAFL